MDDRASPEVLATLRDTLAQRVAEGDLPETTPRHAAPRAGNLTRVALAGADGIGLIGRPTCTKIRSYFLND
jgi:hypothetical protein